MQIEPISNQCSNPIILFLASISPIFLFISEPPDVPHTNDAPTIDFLNMWWRNGGNLVKLGTSYSPPRSFSYPNPGTKFCLPKRNSTSNHFLRIKCFANLYHTSRLLTQPQPLHCPLTIIWPKQAGICIYSCFKMVWSPCPTVLSSPADAITSRLSLKQTQWTSDSCPLNSLSRLNLNSKIHLIWSIYLSKKSPVVCHHMIQADDKDHFSLRL